jgi:hypothetical protein
MNRVVAYLPVFVIASFAHPVASQEPKPERSMVGRWELKSVTVDGKNAPEGSKALAGLLEHAGGVEIGMLYRIGEKNIVMNGHSTEYGYEPKEMTMGIEYPNEKGEDSDLFFTVKFLEKKKLQLSYRDKKAKQKEKKVVLIFAPED